MGKQFFFTDHNAITGTQGNNDAYGALAAAGGQDRFQLENKFTVNANASAIAICKSLLIAQEDSSDAALLNIALLPLETSSFQNIPVKFIIYRGISKASLYGSDNKIITNFTGWKNEQNILYRIKQIQDEINTKNSQSVEATKKYLGCHITQDLYLEQSYFIENSALNGLSATDVFHPIVVDAGFEIGKFKGGTTKAGIQVVLDRIGYEPKLADLRKSGDIFELPTLPPIALAEAIFKDRYRREKILAYMDYTALLGVQYNNAVSKVTNYTVSAGQDISTDIVTVLDKFYNKNTVYFDIRDDYGYSYNHQIDTSDIVKISMKNPGSGTTYVVNDFNYYNSKWPILQLRDYQVSTTAVSSESINISFPILNGDPVFDYYVYSYTKDIGKKFSRLKTNDELSKGTGTAVMLLDYSNSVTFTNKANSSGIFVSNYFLLKLSSGKFLSDNPMSGIFPLHMNTLLGDDNLSDGDFKVYTYSSINVPLIRKKSTNVYLAEIGIAKDKHNVTFFSYEANSVKSDEKSLFPSLKLITTGNFKYQAYLSEFQYQPNQTLGFLTALPYRFLNSSGVTDYDLKEFSLKEDNSDVLTKVLSYVKVGDGLKTDNFFKNFDAIALANSEYRTILNIMIGATNPTDYETNFDAYFTKYIKRINFSSNDLSETFASDDHTILRYFPAFLQISPGEMTNKKGGTDLYSVRTDRMLLKVYSKETEVDTNLEWIRQVVLDCNLELHSLKLK